MGHVIFKCNVMQLQVQYKYISLLTIFVLLLVRLIPSEWSCLESGRSTLTRVHRWSAVMARVAVGRAGANLAQSKQSNKHRGNPRVV